MNAKELVISKLREGLPVDVALANMPTSLVKTLAMDLIYAKADPVKMIQLTDRSTLSAHLEELLDFGVPVNEIAKKVSLEERKTLELLDRFLVSKPLIAHRIVEENVDGAFLYLEWLYLNGYGDYLSLKNLISKRAVGEVVQHLHLLLWAGLDPVILMNYIGSIRVAQYLELFWEAGATIEEILSVLKPCEKLKKFRWLVCHGAEINLNRELRLLSGGISDLEDLELLLIFGAEPVKLATVLDGNSLVEALPLFAEYWRDFSISIRRILLPDEIIYHIDKIFYSGFRLTSHELRMTVCQAKQWTIAKNFSKLLDAGEDFDFLISILPQNVTDTELREMAADTLLDPEQKALLLEKFSAGAIVRNLDFLESYGFKIDVNLLVEKLNFSECEAHLGELYKRGVKIDVPWLIKGFSSYDFSEHLEILLLLGVDANLLVDQAFTERVRDDLLLLLKYKANPNLLALKLYDDMSEAERKLLLAQGATMWLK